MRSRQKVRSGPEAEHENEAEWLELESLQTNEYSVLDHKDEIYARLSPGRSAAYYGFITVARAAYDLQTHVESSHK
jgi:hypothetical protein